MNHGLLGIVLLATGLAGPAAAGSTPQPTLPPGDRFLFVVDTSSGMASLAKPCRQAVFDLIWSGLGGYMQPGDTYGVWVFNERVETNRLPLQIWRSNSVELASAASRFLQQQRYHNSAQPETVLTTLRPTVQLVRDLVVILVTDGRAPIVGTPFDAAIQAACKQRAPQARKLKQPLLVMLTARNAQWVRWSVGLPGEKLDLPQRVSQPTDSVAPSSPVSQPTPTNPPTPVAQTPTNLPVTPIPAPASPPLGPTSSSTGLVQQTEPVPTPATSNAAHAQPTAQLLSAPPQPNPQPGPLPGLPAQPAQPIESPAALPTNTELTAPEPQVTAQPGAAPSTQSVQPPVAPWLGESAATNPAAPNPLMAPARTAAPPVVLRPKISAIVAAPVPPATGRSDSLASTALVSRPPDRTVARPTPGPDQVQARELTRPSAAATPGTPAPTSLGQTARRPTSRSGTFEPWVMLTVGLGLLLAALILTVVFLRGVRPHSRPSIISQSLNRTRGGSDWH